MFVLKSRSQLTNPVAHHTTSSIRPYNKGFDFGQKQMFMIIPTQAKPMKQALSLELLLTKHVQHCSATHRELMIRAQDGLTVLTSRFGTILVRRFGSSGTILVSR